MTEIRKDPFSGDAVIFTPDRENRPDFSGYKKTIELESENCPFCPGNEEMTPPAVLTLIGENGIWKVRVIPNKFPVLGVEGDFPVFEEGLFSNCKGVGAHEIIIETPSHDTDLNDRPSGHYAGIFSVYRDRIRDLRKDLRLKYIQIFKNHKAQAGATISHHHSQLIALPFIPFRVQRRLDLFRHHFEKEGSLLADEVLSRELKEKKRLLHENDSFVSFAPYCSRVPYQVSIFPKKDSPRFEDVSNREIVGLADIFGLLSGRMNRLLGYPPFNLLLHTAPMGDADYSFFRWSIDILPVTGAMGGFEMGTGVWINTVFPEKAATLLKGDGA